MKLGAKMPSGGRSFLGVIATVLAVMVASCSQGGEPASDANSLPIEVTSRCDDPRGDTQTIGENSWEFVNGIADLASAAMATGRFDANSDQMLLIVGISMFEQSNPIADLALAGNRSSSQQWASVILYPTSPRNDLTYYLIKFQQTARVNEPTIDVLRMSSTESPTIYSATGEFQNGLFSAGIPLDLLEGIGIGSTWSAMTNASLMIDGVLAIAEDRCDGSLSAS
jgi:hypothetical protein